MKFSDEGEVNLNPQLFQPFHEKQNDSIEVDVCDNDGNRPWLYFCLISIIWRCLCFVPSCQGPVVSKAFSLNGGQAENMKQVFTFHERTS